VLTHARTMVVPVVRVFGPKAADHPSTGQECIACHAPFQAGDWTALVVLGPGGDPEEQVKACTGRAYNAVAIEIHRTCATGRPAPEQVQLP
jgi:hypothetical protein